MRSETQPYSTVIAIRLCRTAHAIFPPKFWNYKTNFTRVFVTVSPRRPWDRGRGFYCLVSSRGRHVFDFTSLTDEGIGVQSPDTLNRAQWDNLFRAVENRIEHVLLPTLFNVVNNIVQHCYT